jgi:hypothetical protein
MNTVQKILLGTSTLAVLAGLASTAAAQASSDTASVSATIIRPISITKTTDMAFGTIVRPATGSATVTLGTDGNVTGVTTVGAGRTAAVFGVAGEGGQTYTIGEVATLTGPSSTSLTLTLTKAATGGTISTTAAGGTGVLSNALGAPGAATLTYGASFPVTSTTATGAYTGSLIATVNYQ